MSNFDGTYEDHFANTDNHTLITEYDPTVVTNTDSVQVDITPFILIGGIVTVLLCFSGFFFYYRRNRIVKLQKNYKISVTPEDNEDIVEEEEEDTSHNYSQSQQLPKHARSEALEEQFDNMVKCKDGTKANFLGYAEDGHEKVGMLYFANGNVEVRRLVSFRFPESKDAPDHVTVNLLQNPSSNPNFGKTKCTNPKRVPCTALDSSEDTSSSVDDPDTEGDQDPDSLGNSSEHKESGGLHYLPIVVEDHAGTNFDDYSSCRERGRRRSTDNIDRPSHSAQEGETRSSTRNTSLRSTVSTCSALTSGTVLFE